MKTCAQCQIKYPDALEYCPSDGAQLPPVPGRTQALYDSYIGTTIDGRYLVEAKLGEGGMGVVYAARHVIIDKRVAIKVLKLEAQEEATAGQRFIQEARSASKIGHANIVDITDFGVLPDGSAYFVMEFLEGQTLGQAIRVGPVAPLRVITIAAQIARGLHAAHGKGIIHRDLKPENIFLIERDGTSDLVKIVDFGIAKVQEGGALGGAAGQRLTQIGMVLGTPEYMSPEQATGKDSDHRVDEYALGCMMYEMLTGDVPYKGETSAGTLTKHVFDPIIPPRKKRPDLELPLVLDNVVVKAMAKKADDRYLGMKELLNALDQAGADIESGREVQRAEERHRDTQGSVPSVGAASDMDGLSPARGSRAPLFVGVGAVVVILGAAGAWWALVHNHSNAVATPAPHTATNTTTNPDKVTATTTAVAAKIELRLRSTPSGADVYRDGKVLGPSPQTVTLSPTDKAIEFTFKKDGFSDVSRSLVPDKDQEIGVVLEPHKKRGGDSHAGRDKGKKNHSTSSSSSSSSKQAANHGSHKVGNTDLRDPFK